MRQMRRFKQQLDTKEVEAILTNCTSGVLSLIDDEGYPYAVPLSFVWTEGKIYFHSAKCGHKIDAIKCHDKATFCIICQDEVKPEKYTTYYKSVIAFGKVAIVDNEEEALTAITLLGEKYNPNHSEQLHAEIDKAKSAFVMIRFDIENISGKQARELANN